MVLSENCPKIRQKQDQDAKIATTSKQKLQTRSGNAGLERSKGERTRSVSQITPNNGNGKQTVSKYLTTTMIFNLERKESYVSPPRTILVFAIKGRKQILLQTKIDGLDQ